MKSSPMGRPNPTSVFLLPLIWRGYLAKLGLFLLLAWSSVAHAHRFNESYIYFDVTERTLSGRVEITLHDLTRIKQKSKSVESKLTKTQIVDQKEEFIDYFQDRLKVSHDGQPLELEFNSISFFGTKGRTYAQFYFDVLGVETTPVTIVLSYRGMFEDVDPTHRGFALIGSNTRNAMDENEAYVSLIFSAGDGEKELYLNDEPTKDIARTFFKFGVWQMLLGWGHVLFLVPLLLGAVMRSDSGQWLPAESLGDGVRETAKIVTAFTIAHTATLWIATLTGVTLPNMLVIAGIFLSIAVVAAGNLTARIEAASWKLVALFGIVHGFGFANALDQLGLEPARIALGLGSFNFGIEIGQLALILLLFPIFFALRKLTAYRLVGLKGGSVLAIVLALLWFFGHSFGSFSSPGTASAGGTFG